MTETDPKKANIYFLHPWDSLITTDKHFININDGGKGDTVWTCFYIICNKS